MKIQLIDSLHHEIAKLKFPGFFVVSLCRKVGEELPTENTLFLQNKHLLIQQGFTGRRFVYRNGGWYVFFTFYPTDELVDEKYAMKNMPLNLEFYY